MKNLLTKLIIFNFTAVCGVLAATWAGFVIPAFAADVSYVSYAIAGMLVYGLSQLFYFACKTIDGFSQIRFNHVTDINAYITALGILGTAAGVMIALSAAIVGDNAAAVQDFATVVLGGTKVSFHSTIVGMISWLWFNPCWRMVHTYLSIERKKNG